MTLVVNVKVIRILRKDFENDNDYRVMKLEKQTQYLSTNISGTSCRRYGHVRYRGIPKEEFIRILKFDRETFFFSLVGILLLSLWRHWVGWFL